MWFRFGPGNNLAMESNAAKSQIKARKVFEYEDFARDRWIDGLELDFNLDWCMLLKDSIGSQKCFILNAELGQREENENLIEIDKSEESGYSILQKLPDNHWLVANRNARGNHVKNGSIVDAYGKCTGRLALGDGIQQMQVTDSGAIWVGYFDEGVYGGDPLSHSGFVGFDKDGSKTFDFLEFAHQFQLEPISDCYAFNVISDSEIWMYYYAGNVLLKITDGVLDQKIAGLPALSDFAIANDSILFAKLREQTLELANLRTKKSTVLEPVDEEDRPINFISACARKNRLCLADQKSLYYIDLD